MNFQLQFAYYDGSPYINTKTAIKLSYGPNSGNTNTVSLKPTGYMDSNGVAKIDITLPDSTSGFYVFVRFYFTIPSAHILPTFYAKFIFDSFQNLLNVSMWYNMPRRNEIYCIL